MTAMKNNTIDKYRLFIIIISLCAFADIASAEADNISFPARCQIIKPEFDINLDQNVPYLVLINNTSAYSLWFVALNPQLNINASQIEQMNWSALILTTRQLSMACIEAKRGSEQRISCAGSTVICIYDNISLITEVTNSHWIAENKSLSHILQDIERAGITLAQDAIRK